MPKMTHWNSADPIDVPADKVAVYAQQGWVTGAAKAPAAAKAAPPKDVKAMTTDDVKSAPAKKAPAKKATKKAAKKS